MSSRLVSDGYDGYVTENCENKYLNCTFRFRDYTLKKRIDFGILSFPLQSSQSKTGCKSQLVSDGYNEKQASVQKEESLLAIAAGGFLTLIKKRAATYSPARRSTIGVDGLNFSVRNGKRWNPVAIATSVGLTWLRSKSNQLKECAHTTKVSGN